MDSPSVRAILSRFGGNRIQAADYCERIAYVYPHLTVEYREYRNELLKSEEEKHAAVGA